MNSLPCSDRGVTTADPRPEFAIILGILQRSGTNYLWNLLDQHPACARVVTIGEDFLLANADRLEDFVGSVTGYWDAKWATAHCPASGSARRGRAATSCWTGGVG
jgi:hypothetical protein